MYPVQKGEPRCANLVKDKFTDADRLRRQYFTPQKRRVRRLDYESLLNYADVLMLSSLDIDRAFNQYETQLLAALSTERYFLSMELFGETQPYKQSAYNS